MTDSPTNRVLWWTPLVVLATAIVVGIAMGALTNLINVRISREYFEKVMWWSGSVAVETRLAIQQGMLEGGALGTIAGIALSVTIAASARLRCPAGFGLRTLAVALGLALVCWFIGGGVGAFLGSTVPALWGTRFISVPLGASTVRFAWVGGSIWGAYAGTVIAALISTVGFHLRWKRRVSTARAEGFAVIV